MELYLDNAATTSIDEDALKEYIRLISKNFGSTGSLHNMGQESLALETNAKMKIAKLLKVKPNEIFFNSGATEGNNYAIKGVAFKYKNRGKTLITTKVEHPSVLECFKQLEQDFGFNCIYLNVNEKGVIDINELMQSLNNDVILVSIMSVNHEVGSIMPINEIGKLLKNYPKVVFHTDMTQALGKTPIDLTNVDIATMSAHKIHGLKGSGFLYKKEKIELYPLISGHQAYNCLRAGTSHWQSNVAMAIALENTLRHLKENYNELKNNQIKIIEQLKNIKNVVVNTDVDSCIPGIINFSLINYNPEVIIRALSFKKIYVSSRSVCSVEKKDQVSLTLHAMNKDMKACVSSIRMSFDKPLNEQEVNYLIENIKEVSESIRK